MVIIVELVLFILIGILIYMFIDSIKDFIREVKDRKAAKKYFRNMKRK